MPYRYNAKLSLETLKPTKISVRLAYRSFQYPVGIAENILVEVGKFTFPPIFVISKWKKIAKFLSSWDDHLFTPLMQLFELNRNNSILDIDVIDEILQEDCNALLDEGTKILHSIEGTLLEEEIFAEFDEFMAMTADENSNSKSDTKEPSFEKITINTDYKIKTSLEEPPTDLELKPLLDNLEYVFLEEPYFLPIQLLDDKKPVVQKQRRLNPNMQEVVKKEIMKLLDTGIIYPIVDSPWVSPIHCVPKKGGITVVTNENDELVPTRTITGWREKCHFMVKEGIVLGHKVSSAGLEVDKPKIDVISKLPPPTNIKDTPFEFDDECQKAFELLKEKLTCAPVIVSPNWNLPFELMCDASDFAFEYILVAIDYVSEWAEAQALPTNDARVVVTFLKKLFCRFRMPKALISDRGTHFCNKIIEITMKRYGVNHRFSTSYHPQTSGQVENTNKALKRILEKTVKDNPVIWSRKLDDALWAFRTAYKTPTGTTPYKLIYGKNCHLPFEIEHCAYWALKNCNPDLIAAGEKRMFQLHELDELRHQAYEKSRLYKARTKVWHGYKLKMKKEFKQGNKILLFHLKYKFKQPKLRSRWLGPYVVKHQYPSGYVILYGKDGKTFIVNGYRLKLFHEEDNDPRDAVTPFFPKE
ncbi:reverse transcriptase domain-containing protein [Tanacetum coccineum]|uniref:Reverse transcriptase domain-containing protein n=1 Tax=Tanacetum coccineum TaxID=301880 RepID=A0ABQ4YY02_9ASTR